MQQFPFSWWISFCVFITFSESKLAHINFFLVVPETCSRILPRYKYWQYIDVNLALLFSGTMYPIHFLTLTTLTLICISLGYGASIGLNNRIGFDTTQSDMRVYHPCCHFIIRNGYTATCRNSALNSNAHTVCHVCGNGSPIDKSGPGLNVNVNQFVHNR